MKKNFLCIPELLFYPDSSDRRLSKNSKKNSLFYLYLFSISVRSYFAYIIIIEILSYEACN